LIKAILGQFDVRLATVADCADVAQLLNAAFAEFRCLYTAEAFTATVPSAEVIANRLAEGPTWVISTSEHPIAATVSAVPTEHFIYIRSMAVLPALRGRHLGEMLLHNVEQFAFSRGVLHLRLSTTPFLKSACRLYARWGFRRTEDGPHDLFGTALFTMVKDL
jgi:N-acetylglutamate synthase-like GNAT family acetyltransferase